MEMDYKTINKDKDYYDFSKFVEELYLTEGPEASVDNTNDPKSSNDPESSNKCLIILMARKFFSLFLEFQKMNKRKYESLEIDYKGKCKIISNVALPLFEKDIREGKYKKIVIADDIIIHGRSIAGIYDRLKKWNDSCDIRIKSFLCNAEDSSSFRKIQKCLESKYYVETDYWKKISTKIVDSFYMTGTPYISYLPYLTIDGSWEELCSKFDTKDCYSIDNEIMRNHSVTGVLYTGNLLKEFQDLKFSLMCSLRLYYYKNIDKIVMIPYFCMDMISYKSLTALSDQLRDNDLQTDYGYMVKNNHNAEVMRVIELEYVFSYWMAKMIVNRLDLPVKEWHFDVEKYSFGTEIISHDTNNVEVNSGSEWVLHKLNDYKDIKTTKVRKVIKNKDIELLLKCYKGLEKTYCEDYSRWTKQQFWYPDIAYESLFVENLLYENGELDESRVQDECETISDNEKNNRLLGIPLSVLIKNMGRFLSQLNGENPNRSKSRVFASIIGAVDSGKGSIFSRYINSQKFNNICQYGSLLHAGEQNYAYLDNINFPTMYAFYLIEQMEITFDEKNESKQKFITEFSQYLTDNNIFYSKEGMQQLAIKDISTKYGEYLQFVYPRHKNSDIMKKALNKALKIVASIENEKQTSIST